MANKKTKAKNFNDHINTLTNNNNNKYKINNNIVSGLNKKIKRNRIKQFDFMKTISEVAEETYKRTSHNIKYSHKDILTCPRLILCAKHTISIREPNIDSLTKLNYPYLILLILLKHMCHGESTMEHQKYLLMVNI